MELRAGPGLERAALASSRTSQRATWAFACAVALLGAVQLLALAPWMGEDEPWHLEYARHVAAGYRPWGGEPMRGASAGKPDDRELLPLSQLQVRRRFAGIPHGRLDATQRAILGSMAEGHYYQRVDWAGVEPRRHNFDQVAPDFSAATQPPFYYLVAGGLLALVPSEDVEVQLWTLRGLSLALYVAAALVALAIARAALSDERLALCAAALFAFLPMSARQAAVVNNDVLAKLIVALVLLYAVRALSGVRSRVELALALALCGLGLLTKSTAATGLVALAALPFLRSQRLGRHGRTLACAGLALVVGVAAFVWITQHNPAVPRSWTGLVDRLSASLSAENWVGIGRTLVASFGWESRYFPDALNLAVLGLGAAALALAARAAWRGTALAPRPVLVLCLVVVAVQLAMIVLRGAARGRYLMPALPAFALLAVVGLFDAWPEAARERAIRFVCIGLVAFEALFLWGGLAYHEYLRWSV